MDDRTASMGFGSSDDFLMPSKYFFESPPSVMDSPRFDTFPSFRSQITLLPPICHSCSKEFGNVGGTTYPCNHRLCKECASPISEGNQCPLCAMSEVMPHLPAQMFLSPVATPGSSSISPITSSHYDVSNVSGFHNLSMTDNTFAIWEQPKEMSSIARSSSFAFDGLNTTDHPPVFSPSFCGGNNAKATMLIEDIKASEKSVADVAENVRYMVERIELGAQEVAKQFQTILQYHMTALDVKKRELRQLLCEFPMQIPSSKGRRYADIAASGEIFSFGKEGNGDGEFCRPWGICIDLRGRVIIADRSNNRIQIFDKDGQFITKFGTSGALPGQFDRPAGIVCNGQNNIIVADKDNHRIQVFNENGHLMFYFGKHGRNCGAFNYPWGVACNSMNHIAVTDTRNHRVQIFNSKGYFLRKCGFDSSYLYKHLDSPRGISFHPDGSLLITDFNNHRVAVWSPRNGSDMRVYGTEGEFEGQFCRPQGITVDTTGNILISDSRNNRIQVFSGDDMRCIATFGGTSLDRPADIAVSPDGRVYVVDFGNSCIRVY